MLRRVSGLNQIALKAVLVYATFSIAWLWFSDEALQWVLPTHSLSPFSFGKGLFYMGLTCVTLYALLSRDFSRLKTTQHELQRSEERLRCLFDHMLDGLVEGQLLFDSSGQACDYVYLEVNQSYYRLTGQSEVAGKRGSEVYPGIRELQPEMLQLFARVVQSGVPERLEFFFQPRQCWLDMSVFRPGPEGSQFAVIFQDTTERRRREQEQQTRRAADAASQMKTEFVANVSHEIRTPLNAILGLSYLAQQATRDPIQRDYLEKIQKAGRGLLALVNDVLDFTKVEEGGLRLESGRFLLDEVLEDVSTSLAQVAFDKGLDFVVSVDPRVPTWIRGDSLRLGQILTNLLSNAVKFTEEGGVALEITLVEETLQFRVQDSGIGMDETQRQGLFLAFTQGDASITRKYGGTGLGLAISQRLAQHMGGAIEVESEPGRGSTFTLLLPLERCQQETPDSLQGVRVLVVDEEQQNLKVLPQILQSAGATVTLLNYAQVADHPESGFDFALIHLGNQNGVRIAHQLLGRAHKRILIARPGVETLMAKEVALDGLLVMPVLRSRLLEALREKTVYSAPPRWVFESARVLAVEDHPDNQQVIRELLEGVGLTVDLADDGGQALELLSNAPPDRWQVVLMDLHMPVLDGYETTRRIRQLPQWSHLPILALSSLALPQEREKCRDVGMNDYLTKPVEPEQLFEKLAAWLPSSGPEPLAVPEDLDWQALDKIAQTLDQQLSGFEGAATDSLETLAALLRPLGPLPALAQLSKDIERFEFEEARVALAGLRQQLASRSQALPRQNY